jgi:hypothetical protein
MEIVTVVLYSCGGVVTCLCLGIEIDKLLRVDVVLCLLSLACSLLILILAMLLDACVLVDLLVLAAW